MHSVPPISFFHYWLGKFQSIFIISLDLIHLSNSTSTTNKPYLRKSHPVMQNHL